MEGYGILIMMIIIPFLIVLPINYLMEKYEDSIH
jgi:hypothetical protein